MFSAVGNTQGKSQCSFPQKATFYYQSGMIYGKRGSLKKENEVTKEISDPLLKKVRNFATNPEALL